MKSNKIPAWIEIRHSNIPGAGLGAFTKVDLKKGLRLGEYTGTCLTPQQYDKSTDHIYVWEIKEKNAPILYINGRNPKLANWTRYVNCPRSRKEENVEAVQVGLKMFYYAKRRIQAGEELLVWYGSGYARWLLGKARLD